MGYTQLLGTFRKPSARRTASTAALFGSRRSVGLNWPPIYECDGAIGECGSGASLCTLANLRLGYEVHRSPHKKGRRRSASCRAEHSTLWSCRWSIED